MCNNLIWLKPLIQRVFRDMDLLTEHLLDSNEPNDRHVVNEQKERKGTPSRNETTVTPYLLEEWKESMMFWKNHDTCRRMFNWVREVLGSLDETFLKKIFNKLLHDGELVNDHVRMYLQFHGYNVEGREIIDTPYWMHIAFLQVMHLVYLDDDIMLSEMIEELTRPRLEHKNAKKITIMLNMFYGYVSERSFLMTEFTMDDWRNNFDRFVNDVENSTQSLPRDVIIEECSIENKDHLTDGVVDQVNPVFTVDDTGHSGDDPDVQPCSSRFVSDYLSLSNDEANEGRADKSINCTLNNNGATYKPDENELVSTNDLIISSHKQIDTPSLGDAHPSWDCLVFQSSPGKPGRKTKVRLTAKEKAKFNTLVFSSFLGVEHENVSIISSTSKSSYGELVLGIKNRIFYGLTIFFKDRALHIRENLRTLVTQNGGEVCDKLKKNTTHVITCKPVPWYKVDELRRSTNCRVVKPEWILESLRVGRRVSENTFNMAGIQQSQPTILKFINGDTNDQLGSDGLPDTRKREREGNDISTENKRHRVNSYVGSEIQSSVQDVECAI
ncbi:DNA repair protein REV1 isoform X2 [Rhizophagus clarus]|uniref:DNA repair protein REV1 isoform X2 n=1 Tax=Rhizophagus clarus TaxID=94130 RepID=A0A8H3LWZ1_9GLOM|nr:DNA repair protein REV1 isoform X2 [Rhizophagus clarus]